METYKDILRRNLDKSSTEGLIEMIEKYIELNEVKKTSFDVVMISSINNKIKSFLVPELVVTEQREELEKLFVMAFTPAKKISDCLILCSDTHMLGLQEDDVEREEFEQKYKKGDVKNHPNSVEASLIKVVFKHHPEDNMIITKEYGKELKMINSDKAVENHIFKDLLTF